MNHNPIHCAHCGNPFDLSGSASLLVDGKVFEALCERCRATHIFSIHVLYDVATFEGSEKVSVMVDVHPKTPPSAPRKTGIVLDSNIQRAKELIQSGRVAARKISGDGEELEAVSQGTYDDLNEVFGNDFDE